MTHLVAPLAEPYTQAELAEFEQLIFACNNDQGEVRVLARAAIAAFFKTHGQAKCDLMMERLTKAHEGRDGETLQ